MNLPMKLFSNTAHDHVNANRNVKEQFLEMDHLIQNQLNCLASHTLKQQDDAALMDRQDEKFVIQLQDFPILLRAARDHYSVLSEQGVQQFSYRTRYFDTEKKHCYHHHHSGKSKRFKLRIRRYEDSQSTFVECKLKNNKGRTNKLRRVHQGGFSLASASDFLFQTLSVRSCVFQPVLDVHYYRITLMNRERDQRITCDLNLTFENCQSGTQLNLANTVVVEIKQDQASRNSHMGDILKKLSYMPKDFSKYCMGCVLTRVDGIKYNRFKSNILYLKKLENKSYPNTKEGM